MSTDHWTLCCLLLCPFLAKIFFPAVCVVIYMHVAYVHITCMVLLGGGIYHVRELHLIDSTVMVAS